MNIMTAVEFAEMVLQFAHKCNVCGKLAKADEVFSDGTVTCSKSCTQVKLEQVREAINEAY